MPALVPSRRGGLAAATLLLAVLSLPAMPAHAQWPTDPNAGGLPVCTAPDYQWYQQAFEDGAGGLFIVWRDDRHRTVPVPDNYDVYAQHLSAAGIPLWGAGGIAVCTAVSIQDRPALCGDGAGGLYVAWTDARTGNNDIWAQHLDAAGSPAWPLDGLRAARLDAANDHTPTLAADGAGGLLVIWHSYDPTVTPQNTRLRAQRMNSSGFQLWSSIGVAVGGPAGNQSDPRLIEDSAGGIVLSWVQASSPRSVRAQRLNGSGAKLWEPTGIAVTDTTRAASRTHYLLAGPAGGARFLVHDTAIVPTPRWRDVDASGATLRWDLLLPATAWGEIMSSACAGDSGATLVTTTNGAFESVQRLAQDGTLDWGPHGLPVSPDTLARTFFTTIARDGEGGAYLVGRAVDTTSTYYELRAQHVRWDQSLAWEAEGRAFASALTGDQQSPLAFATEHGVIALWQDYRTVTTTGLDLYAQRMDSTGALGAPVLDAPPAPLAAVVTLSPPWPNPARASERVLLRFSLPQATRVRLALHDIAGRRVGVLANGVRDAGEHQVPLHGNGGLAPGLYFARLTTAQGVALTRRVVVIR